MRVLCALLSLSVVTCLGPVLTASPAAASVTVLCKGYDGCKALGMGHAGYKAASSSMYWRMYAGHNCTNYVAYRMVRSGLPNVRPWTGSGNAMYWGGSMPTITDAVPAVGAVAWWKANVKGASGSAGHVAYVEQVVSADEIIVSQDSWGGDFSWARIVRTGGAWPSGFIHFNDLTLTNTLAPALSGTPRVGLSLTVSPGTWKQTGITFGYQWLADGVPIPGATASTLTLTKDQQDTAVSVRTSASKLGFPTVVLDTPATTPVEPGDITSTAPPTVTGTPRVDGELAATPGLWNPEPTAVAYQWAADGVPVPGATAATFTPGPDQVGKAMTVVVTASKPGYLDVSAPSAATAPVAPGTIARTGKKLLTGTARFGETLTLDAGKASPLGSERSIEWLRGGVPVEGANGTTYQLTAADLGARVAPRVTYTKPGYTPLVTTLPATARVKTLPVVRAAATPAKGKVGLSLTVRAPGAGPVVGTVTIRSHGQVLKQLTLREGTATTTLRGLTAGTHPVRVVFAATDTVTRGVLVREVRVR
jgi:surface antigen